MSFMPSPLSPLDPVHFQLHTAAVVMLDAPPTVALHDCPACQQAAQQGVFEDLFDVDEEGWPIVGPGDPVVQFVEMPYGQ